MNQHSGNGLGEDHRSLGMTSLVSLVVANMIGAGIYSTSGFCLAELGTPQRVLAMWGVAAVIAIVGALCYGGLSKQLVQSGGEYLFLSRAIHPLAGFMAGWISLLAGFSGAIAFAATTFVNYLPTMGATGSDLASDGTWLSDPQNRIFVAVALIAACATIHLYQMRQGALTQNVFVIVKLVLIAGFIALGMKHLVEHRELLVAPNTPSATIAAHPSLWTYANQLMWISFSFAGFNASIYLAGQAKLGQVTVRRSMLFAAVGVSVIYLLLNAVFLFSTETQQIVGQKDIATIAARAIGGPSLASAIQWLVVLSLATSVSAMLQAGPRVYVKMAQDGLLPQWLIDPDGSARTATLLQAYLATLLVCAAPIKDLLDYTSFLLSVSSAATVGCLLLKRFRGQSGNRPVWFWPWTPIAFCVATMIIAATGCWYRFQTTSPRSMTLSLIVFLSGIVIYFIQRSANRTPRDSDATTKTDRWTNP